MGEQTERRPQRLRLARLAALLVEPRQQPGGLCPDQRMRARARAAADRRHQRARVNVLLQPRDHGEGARGAGVAGGGREARSFLGQQLVVRPLRPRGPRRARNRDDGNQQGRRRPVFCHGRRDYSEFQRLRAERAIAC
jgi:hypothetical protein